MSTSTEGGLACEGSQSAFASASGDRSRLRVRKMRESAAVRMPTSSAERKMSASPYSKLKADAGSVSVIRHQAYCAIMAKLPATMAARPVATGFGHIAAQTRKTPKVASAGRAAARIVSSTTPNMGLQLAELERLRGARPSLMRAEPLCRLRR